MSITSEFLESILANLWLSLSLAVAACLIKSSTSPPPPPPAIPSLARNASFSLSLVNRLAQAFSNTAVLQNREEQINRPTTRTNGETLHAPPGGTPLGETKRDCVHTFNLDDKVDYFKASPLCSLRVTISPNHPWHRIASALFSDASHDGVTTAPPQPHTPNPKPKPCFLTRRTMERPQYLTYLSAH